MTDTGNDLPRGVHVELLRRELLLVVAHHPKEPVGVQVDGPDVTVLTASHHHVVGDRNNTVDAVRVAGELVRVEPVLVLTEEIKLVDTSNSAWLCNLVTMIRPGLKEM